MRRAFTLILTIALSLTTTSATAGAEPPGLDERAALDTGRTRAAKILDVATGELAAVSEGTGLTEVGGRRFWTSVFADRSADRQAFVAVDVETGETFDAAAFDGLVDADLAQRPRISPPARERLDQARRAPRSASAATRSPLLAYVLDAIDYAPAIEAVKARHPEIEWVDGRPVGDDLAVLGPVSQELMQAKAALLAKARAPFLERVRAQGASEVIPLDLAPMVYVRAAPARLEALADDDQVREVLAPASWEPAMNVAHDAIGADYSDRRGFRGSGVIVGLVEYTRVDYSNWGLGPARLDSYRVSSTGLSCPHSRGLYRNSTAMRHASWAAAIAVGRGVRYKGIADRARMVDVSADRSPTSDAADPRILKAVDCAILLGGAHVVTLSLVQNDRSSFSTSNAYFDAVAWDHHRLVVGNGGNNYSESNSNCPGSNEIVQSPGSSWNTLTVGGATNNGRRLWYRSRTGEPSFCWENPPGHPGDRNDRVKPELVAPAQSISSGFANGSGVSAATPMVAGVAAIVIGQRPSLLNFPEITKAIIIAASETRHAYTPAGRENESVEGLGVASAKWSSIIATKDTRRATGDFGGITFEAERDGDCYEAPEARTVDFLVGATDRKVRFVIDWMAHTSGADPRDQTATSRRYADFDLTIRKGSTVVKTSARSASNVEWVDFRGSTHGSGTYTAVITPVRWGCPVDTEPVGWSWVSFATP